MKKNLNVWAIQYYPEELLNAMSNINDGLNIIYSNVKCNLNIGKQKINSRQFDTILYNEESNILIMLMRDGLVFKEDIIKYLEDKGKEYVEINFDYSIFDYKEKDNVPELWFAQDKNVLEKALKDSLCKNNNICKYYPLIKSELKFGYLSKYFKYINLTNLYFRGLIKLDDKIIMIINNNKLGMFNVLEIIDNLNIDIKIAYDEEPSILEENFSKKLKLRK